jgi:hypothetical protein
VLVGLLLVLATATPTPGPPQHWEAVSKTAMSITGDVVFTPSRITFANGKAVDIRYVATRSIPASSSTPHGAAARFTLYEVLTKTDPKLLHGNALCGTKPAYVGIAASPASGSIGTSMFVNFFTGAPAPKDWDSQNLCGSFTYALVP